MISLANHAEFDVQNSQIPSQTRILNPSMEKIVVFRGFGHPGITFVSLLALPGIMEIIPTQAGLEFGQFEQDLGFKCNSWCLVTPWIPRGYNNPQHPRKKIQDHPQPFPLIPIRNHIPWIPGEASFPQRGCHGANPQILIPKKGRRKKI